MNEYFENLYEAIKEFDKYNKENAMPTAPNNASYYSHPDMYENKPTPRVIKPLYMLIKVDVDADIVYNQAKAHTYAMNHCDKLEYELVDYHYPTKYSEREHPFIKL